MSIDESCGLAEKTMARMAALAMPPSPENYCLWYLYYQGRDLDLIRDLDRIADKWESPEGRELRLRHLRRLDLAAGPDGEMDSGVQSAASENLERIATDMLRQMALAGRNASHYRDALDGFSSALDDTRSVGELRGLAADLATRTRAVAARTRALEERLAQSTREVDSLRGELESTRRDAETDGLTGIANRKCFDLNLARLVTAPPAEQEPFCLLLLDIDRFKSFNDRYGHPIGDQVLRLVANTLKNGLKGRDLPARYGGEEFGILLPQTGLHDALTVANQIRLGIAGKRIVRRDTGEKLERITVSVGVAQGRTDESAASLTGRADKALYRAKNSGRNRVVADGAG